MRPDSACDTVTAALVAGEAPDPHHLAGCADCRARVAVVGALHGADPRAAAVFAPVRPPSVSALRSGRRARAMRRAGFVATSLVLAVVAVLMVRPAPAPEVDLLGALDDADRALSPPDDRAGLPDALSDEALLALVDPLVDPLADELPADDPFASDPLLDALLGEGSL